MSDIVNEKTTVGKVLIAGIIVLSLFVTAYVWDKVDNNRMLSAIEGMLSEQAKIENVKKCVKENYDIAEEQWVETKAIIGLILQENGITFPQDLNIALQKYDKKRNEIKDCLIFPGN